MFIFSNLFIPLYLSQLNACHAHIPTPENAYLNCSLFCCSSVILMSIFSSCNIELIMYCK
jgi:hypothetical protein